MQIATCKGETRQKQKTMQCKREIKHWVKPRNADSDTQKGNKAEVENHVMQEYDKQREAK